MMSFLGYLKNVLILNKGLDNLPLAGHRGIYKTWRHQVESVKFPLDLELPWITLLAKNDIEKYLENKPKEHTKIFEYGSGGSSLFFLKYASEVVSVEHDKDWFDLVRKRVSEKKITGWDGHLIEPEPIPADLKTELDVSNPHHYYSDDKKFEHHTFKNYASYISKFPDQYFDVVLVDGRSRPSCLLHSVNKVKNGGLLVLDNAERKYYLSNSVVKDHEFKLIRSSYGALIGYDQFTQTNIYKKK